MCVELYGTVCVNVSFRVTSWSVITQTFEFGTVSAIEACMWSPGWIVIEIASEGPGMISHHAEYSEPPVAGASCSVPVWISVLSPTMQLASTQPPPMPIQSDENSSCPFVCELAVGTVQSPVDRVEECAAHCERAEVVAEPVRALVRVRLDVQ